MEEIDLGRLSLPELTELLHRIADEIQLRAMEEAGKSEDQRGRVQPGRR